MLDKENCSLDGSEILGRDVISESRAERANRTGRIAHDIFSDSSKSNKISVSRLSCDTRIKMAELARNKGDKKFYGWAILKVEKVTSKGTRKVVASPLPSNPYHADIILLDLPDDEVNRRAALKTHYKQLADIAEWEIAPGMSLE